MKRHNEKGTALIFALIFVLVLSTLAASLTFLAQSETWSSLNYRLMTQSRYGAEAGLHAGANYLMSSTYSGPGSLGNYNTAVSPVTYQSNPAALGYTLNGMAQNFPSQNSSFPSSGTIQSGNNNVNYYVSAELLAVKQITTYQCADWSANGQPLITQLWKLTSHGDVSGARNSEVEVSALLESHSTPCFNYAGYATGNGVANPCGLITFNGGGTVSSYDSSAPLDSHGNPVLQSYDGNLGANGNVNTANNTTINGSFSSPDTGVGNCASGAPSAVSGGGTITGCQTSTTNCGTSVVQMPQVTQYPIPSIPSSVPSPATNVSSTASLTPCVSNCPKNGANNGNYGDISLSGGTVTFTPGVSGTTCVAGIYYVNSITLSGNGKITVAPCADGTYQPVIINVVGQNNSAPLTLTGNGLANPSYQAGIMQIDYSGTGAVAVKGNGTAAAVIYAPNAPVTLTGNGAIYGSVIGASLTDNGNPVTINYDRQLSTRLQMPGNWTMDTFTWSKF